MLSAVGRFDESSGVANAEADDTTSSADERRRDHDLDALRAREASSRAAYAARPSDEGLRALVRTQQQLRRAEEDRARLAANDGATESALEDAPIALHPPWTAAAAAPFAAPTIDLTTPADALDATTARRQCDLALAQLAIARDPAAQIALGSRVAALTQRLTHLEADAHADPPPVDSMTRDAAIAEIRELSPRVASVMRAPDPGEARRLFRLCERVVSLSMTPADREAAEAHGLRVKLAEHGVGCYAGDDLASLRVRYQDTLARERRGQLGAPHAAVDDGEGVSLAEYERRMGMWLDIVHANDPLSSMAFVCSVMTGESLDAAHARVAFASAVFGVAGSMAFGNGQHTRGVGEAALPHEPLLPHPSTTRAAEPMRVESRVESPLATRPGTSRSGIAPAEAPPLRATGFGTTPATTRRGAGLPSSAAARASFAESQRTPCGKHWAARDLTFDEFREHYRARSGAKGMSDAKLRAEYELGKRLNPETGYLKMPGAAVYATAEDKLGAGDIDGAHHAKLEAAERAQAEARRESEIVKHKVGATSAEIKAAERVLNRASERLGEAGADAYVYARYPGPPPPERVWPPRGAEASSGSGSFDRVFRVAPKYGKTWLVVEAKGASAELKTRQVDGAGNKAEQGTRRYFETIVSTMRNDRTNTARRRLGEQLASSLDSTTYLYVSTSAEPSTITAREFDSSVDTGVRQ